jgi:hypothetical protein
MFKIKDRKNALYTLFWTVSNNEPYCIIFASGVIAVEISYH